MIKQLTFLAAWLILLTACGQKIEAVQLTPDEFSTQLKTPNKTLLDVRTDEEYQNSHIDGAGQLNYYASDFLNKLLLLPRNQPIYLYCTTGYRSNKVANILLENGYEQVFNLKGGIMGWSSKNYPITQTKTANTKKENAWAVNDFNEVATTDSLLFIDFYAPWCGPCRKMLPLVDSLKAEYAGKIKIVKVNADASKELISALKVSTVPYFELRRSNQILFSKAGMIPRKELETLFRANLSQ